RPSRKTRSSSPTGVGYRRVTSFMPAAMRKRSASSSPRRPNSSRSLGMAMWRRISTDAKRQRANPLRPRMLWMGGTGSRRRRQHLGFAGPRGFRARGALGRVRHRAGLLGLGLGGGFALLSRNAPLAQLASPADAFAQVIQLAAPHLAAAARLDRCDAR